VRFIVSEKDRQYEFMLTPGMHVVGRDQACDLTLDSARVSRRHMSCRVGGKAVEVRDLGSRNGVLVGGVRVSSAKLKDGDEVRVGDVRLKLAVAAPPVAPPEPEDRGEAAAPDQGTQEGSQAVALAPPAPPAPGPQLIERKGRWYVVDPGSGREVEIVPAAQAGAGRLPLLASKRNRMILVGAAVLVAVLLLLGLVRGGSGGRGDGMATREYTDLVEGAVQALQSGDSAGAAALAARAKRGMPGKEPAGIVGELAAGWDAWSGDFFGHWEQMDGQLKDLVVYADSEPIKKFATRYRVWIRDQLADLALAERALQQFRSGDYEGAWQELEKVRPAARQPSQLSDTSPVRERYAELFKKARERLQSQLKDAVARAEAQQDWAAARAGALKLARYFPETSEEANADVARYGEMSVQASVIESARGALAAGRFADAQRRLNRIPEGSPYHPLALRLRDQVKADEQYTVALGHYNRGEGEVAIELLSRQEGKAAADLKRQVERTISLRRDARQAQDQWRLPDAERLWLELSASETDTGNTYRREALQEIARMGGLREARARETVRQAGELLKAGKIEEARKRYEDASAMDPKGQAGEEGMKRMADEGRDAYLVGVNKVNQDPKEALRLLERACRLLPAESGYYAPAREALEELKGRLQGGSRSEGG